MDVDRARAHTGVPSSKATYFLVRVGQGADVQQVRRDLLASLTDVEVLTPAEFRERSRSFWLFGTGAGAALFAGALLGVIVGTVIVAQTLYSSTKDHLNEFATLRAIGSSRRYIYKVIICQALLSAVIGFGLAYRRRASGGAHDGGERAADRHHAGPHRRAVPADRRDVRRLGDRRDHEGDPHRSRHGVHAMSELVMEATGVVKDLGVGVAQIRALKGVDLALKGGELTLLMGPSGSGKTTLLSILGCMLTPTEGTVRVRGDSIAGKNPEDLAKLRRENIGFVFQSYHLFPTLSAADNVRLALDVRGETGTDAKDKARAALDRVGLASKTRNYPSQLSGGEQQRVAIARAVVGDPSVILADEPTAALDSENGKAIMGILAAIAKDPGPRRSGGHPRSAAGAVRRPDRPYRGRQHRPRGSRRGGAEVLSYSGRV